MSKFITDNHERHRYEMDIDGHIVFADYRREGRVLYIPHVEAPPALQGTGAAGRFMEALMDNARVEKLKIVPICGYAAHWIQRHPEYHDLLA